MSYSTNQLMTLALTPKIAASISIPCSLFIIHEVLQDQRRVRKEERGVGKPVDRALLGMSVIDVMASSGWWYSTFLMPKGAPNAIWTTGNTQTCTFQGFLLQIAIGAPLYNCSLSLYYLLQIRYGWSHAQIARRLEKWVHLAIISFSLSTALAGIPLQIFNPVGSTVCWISALPQGCSHDPDIECERGPHAWIFGIVWFYGLIWICVGLTIMAMVLVYGKVRQTHKSLQRHDEGRRNSERRRLELSRHPSTESLTDLEQHAETLNHHQRVALARSKRRERQVACQAILYSLGFFITWMPSTVWSVFGWFSDSVFWLDFLSGVCEPTQGLVNFLIFIRIRPHSRRKIARFFPCFRWCLVDVGDDDLEDVYADDALRDKKHKHQQQQQQPPQPQSGLDESSKEEQYPPPLDEHDPTASSSSGRQRIVHFGEIVNRICMRTRSFGHLVSSSFVQRTQYHHQPFQSSDSRPIEFSVAESRGRAVKVSDNSKSSSNPSQHSRQKKKIVKQLKSLTSIEIEMGRSNVGVPRDSVLPADVYQSANTDRTGSLNDDDDDVGDDRVDCGPTINISTFEHQKSIRNLEVGNSNSSTGKA